MNKSSVEIFHNFFRSKQHLLEMGDSNWPTDRILYQLCYEHAENSPITHQAELYFKDGRVNWKHFRQINRKKTLEINPNYRTFSRTNDKATLIDSGYEKSFVKGVHLLENNQVLSWSKDGTLSLWNLKDGSSKIFEGHTKGINGIHLLENNQALSDSADGTLRLWNLKDGSSKVFKGHTGTIKGLHLLENS